MGTPRFLYLCLFSCVPPRQRAGAAARLLCATSRLGQEGADLNNACPPTPALRSESRVLQPPPLAGSRMRDQNPKADAIEPLAGCVVVATAETNATNAACRRGRENNNGAATGNAPWDVADGVVTRRGGSESSIPTDRAGGVHVSFRAHRPGWTPSQRAGNDVHPPSPLWQMGKWAPPPSWGATHLFLCGGPKHSALAR